MCPDFGACSLAKEEGVTLVVRGQPPPLYLFTTRLLLGNYLEFFQADFFSVSRKENYSVKKIFKVKFVIVFTQFLKTSRGGCNNPPSELLGLITFCLYENVNYHR